MQPLQPSPSSIPASAVSNDLPVIELYGVRIHAITEQQCIDHIMQSLADKRGGWIITPNLDHLRRTRKDAAFRTMFDEADVIVADGMPLIWASRMQKTALPERVAGSSLVSTIAEAAAAHERCIFLLGGDPGAAEGAAAELTQRYANLRICGTHVPPFGFENNAEQMQKLHQILAQAQPDIVYVALGSPKQENLIRQLRGDFPHTWWIGIGISLSFLSGQVQRAPRWMQRLGLEWIHRLGQEPGRLARRYLVDGLPFAFRLFAHTLKTRFAR